MPEPFRPFDSADLPVGSPRPEGALHAPVISSASATRPVVSLDDLDDLDAMFEAPSLDAPHEVVAPPIWVDEPDPAFPPPFETIVMGPGAFPSVPEASEVDPYQPVSLKEDPFEHLPMEMVLNRQFEFNDAASAAVLAAIPPRIGDRPITLTHLELRAVVSNVVQNMGDMPPAAGPEAAAEEPVRRLESTEQVIADADARIQALRVRFDELQDRAEVIRFAISNPTDAEGSSVLEGVEISPAALDRVRLEMASIREEIIKVSGDRTRAAVGAQDAALWVPEVQERADPMTPEAYSNVLPDLPDPKAALARAEVVIRELKDRGYLVEVPRTQKALDDIDRTVRVKGFPDAWRNDFTAKAPTVAYQLTPDGMTAGSLIRMRNDGPVTGISATDRTEVMLPAALELVAYAGADAGHELLLDHFDAGLLRPGDLGRALTREALSIRDSLLIPGNNNPEVVGARVVENLDAAVQMTRYTLSEVPPEVPVEELPIRPQEIRDILGLTRDTVASVPVLAADAFIRERMTVLSGIEDALDRLLPARKAVQEHGIIALGRPEAWQGGPQSLADLDLRPSASLVHAGRAFEQKGVRPELADMPLVWDNERRAIMERELQNWIEGAVQSEKLQERAIFALFGESRPGGAYRN